MNLKQLQVLAVETRVKYDQLNQQKRGLTWNEQQLMAGFVGDVGDLSKIIQAKHGLRPMDDIAEKVAHELADCLWCVLVLADKYGIDLDAEFQNAMKELGNDIDKELTS